MASTKTTRTAAKQADSEKSFSLISDETFRRMYAAMLGCRLLEERVQRELRSRRASKSLKQRTVAPLAAKPLTGREAVIIGSTLELRADDTITAPSGEVIFRQPATRKPAGKAAQVRQALAAARRNVIAFAAASGAQLTVGAGVALAYKDFADAQGTGRAHASADTRSEGRIVVSFGDADPGSMASWQEALQLAGAYKLPILFVLRPGTVQEQNNVASICEQAALAGVISIPVDSTDAVAIYRVSFESIARARRGTSATLIVCTEFKVDGEPAAKKPASADPIARMEAYLTKKGLFSAKWKAQVLRELK